MTTAPAPTPLFASSPAHFEVIGGQIAERPLLAGLVAAILAAASAFFVAADVALRRVHASQLEDAVEQRKRGAALALKLSARPGLYLPACQIGAAASALLLGLVGGVLAVSWCEPLFARLPVAAGLAPWLGMALGILALAVLHAVLCQQLPRALGYRKPAVTAIACAPPLRSFFPLAYLPARAVHFASALFVEKLLKLDLVDGSHSSTTEDDLRIMVEETGRARVVTETEREILENALELNELCARDIITPRNEVIDLDVHRTFHENLNTAIESKHTRFPLVDGHLDQALGLIHLKDLLREMQRESPNLFAAKRDLLRVSEKLPLDELLKLFLTRRAHMALVVDQFGGSLGVVTLDDVLDEVVGEINDEFDEEEEPSLTRIDDSHFIVEGWVPLHELADEVEDLELESPEVSTIGGYLTSLFGRLPEAGDQIRVEGYLATVEGADDRVIEKIRFEKLAPEDLGGEHRDEENSDAPSPKKPSPEAHAPGAAPQSGVGAQSPPVKPPGQVQRRASKSSE